MSLILFQNKNSQYILVSYFFFTHRNRSIGLWRHYCKNNLKNMLIDSWFGVCTMFLWTLTYIFFFVVVNAPFSMFRICFSKYNCIACCCTRRNKSVVASLIKIVRIECDREKPVWEKSCQPISGKCWNYISTWSALHHSAKISTSRFLHLGVIWVCASRNEVR